MKILASVLIILTISLVGFGQTKQKKIKINKNPNRMKQEIAKLIPIGSSVADAQNKMETNEFYCRFTHGGSFTTGSEDKPDREYKNIDFLSCRRTKYALAGFLDPRRLTYMRLYEIAIVQKDGVVSDILVYVGWFCEL